MFFYVLLFLTFSPFFGLSIGLVMSVVEYIRYNRITEDCVFYPIMGGLIGVFVALFPAVGTFGTWNSHASDIAKVEAQHHRIEVFEERIESLNVRLSEFNYPDKPMVSVDADTPWASMVRSLTEAETQLANAKDEKAVAIRSIHARMRGPFSGVIDFVGLPEGMEINGE